MRLSDWEEQLSSYYLQCWRKPFKYGVHDCCTFAAEVVEQLVGKKIPLGLDHKGKLLREYKSGRLKLENAVEESLSGFEEVPPLSARRGDVMLYQQEGRTVIGVCNGATILSPGKDGMGFVPISAGQRAWRIA